MTAAQIQIGNHWVPARFVRTYIDGKPRGSQVRNEEPEAEIAEAIKAQVSPASYSHMISKKQVNTQRIIDSIKAGANTQQAIRQATGISQGAISTRLTAMEKDDEVRVNRGGFPWIYSIPEIAA